MWHFQPLAYNYCIPWLSSSRIWIIVHWSRVRSSTSTWSTTVNKALLHICRIFKWTAAVCWSSLNIILPKWVHKEKSNITLFLCPFHLNLQTRCGEKEICLYFTKFLCIFATSQESILFIAPLWIKVQLYSKYLLYYEIKLYGLVEQGYYV